MDAPSSGLKLREEVSARFPADAAQVTARVAELGYEPDALTAWFELFSQRTTEAMRSRDVALVRSHLDFMAEILVTANT